MNRDVTLIEVDVDALASGSRAELATDIRRLEHCHPGLRLIPYAGLDPKCSMLAGGRLRGNSIDELIELARLLNRERIPIAVALSGGVTKYRRDNTYNDPIDLKRDPVYPLLLEMVRGNDRTGLPSSLTILRDDLLDELDRVFPDHGLETWASCIRFVGELGADEYRARLDLAMARYDAAVIDNPSTERILIRENRPQRIAKLVIFLNSKCAIDSQICNAHYLNIERGIDLYQRTQGPIKEMLDCCQRDDRATINRPEILSLISNRGVRKLKWQRGSTYSFEKALQTLKSTGILG